MKNQQQLPKILAQMLCSLECELHLFLDIPRHPKPFCDEIMVRSIITNVDCKHTKKHYLSAINFINGMSIYNLY